MDKNYPEKESSIPSQAHRLEVDNSLIKAMRGILGHGLKRWLFYFFLFFKRLTACALGMENISSAIP